MLLKTLRSYKNVTQKEVALAIGVERYTYAKWEQGRAEPSIADLIKLCNYFDCTFEYLVGTENEFGIVMRTSNLTKNESELLAGFNLLSSDNQSKVLGFIKALEK